MKRFLGLGIVLAVIISAVGSTTSVFADSEVVFPDPGLNISVCATLGIPYGSPIMQSELNTVTSFDALSTAPFIQNTSGMEYWTTLTHLAIRDNELVDISSLSALTNLTYLDLYNNNIVDISALAGLTNLTYLDLQFNHIVDMSSLVGMTNLILLAINGNYITNISSLAGMVNLISLDIGSNNISDVSSLCGMINLTNLVLQNNNIVNISSLVGLTNLTNLELYSNNIMDISSLSGMVNLISLPMFTNQITDISPLVGTLSAGCVVFAFNNPLNTHAFTIDIPALLADGVIFLNNTPYTLAYTAGVHGSLGGLLVQYVAPTFNGTAVTAVPNTGYIFRSWSDGSTENPRLDTDVNSDVNVTAGFVLGSGTTPFNASILIAVAIVWVCIGLMFMIANVDAGVIVLAIIALITIVGVVAIIPFL